MPKKGYKQTEEHKRKFIGRIPWNKGTVGLQVNSNKGKKCLQLSGKNNGMYNRHHTEETKQKMRENHVNFSGKNNPNFGKHCSEEIKKKISDSEYGKIVSEETIKKIMGENNPNWRGGISFIPYCIKFNLKLREKIRERDNNICQNCGKTEIENNNRKLSVHHIHYDKENCYPDLITLCCSCNFKVNYNRLYWEYVFMSILTKRKLLNYFGDIK